MPHAPLIYLLALMAIFIFTGCEPQAKPVSQDVAPAPESPVQPTALKEAETTTAVYAPGDAEYPEGYYVHTVSIPAENISIIARWYTGAQKNWRVLVKCNPDIQANRIFIGDTIKIPRILLTRESPLPVEFVQQSHTSPQDKAKKKITPVKPVEPAAPATPPAATEDPLLFGPRG